MSTPTAAASTTPAAHLRQLAGELVARDRWTREQVLAYQQARLEALLRHAVEHSPYYRETLGPEPWRRPLHELPTLTKAQAMERWDDLVCDPKLRLADAEARLASPAFDGMVAPGVHACTTSGSTGRRGVFVFAADELACWAAATVRALARIGVDPGARLCAIGSPSPLHMSRHIFAALAGQPVDTPAAVSALTPMPELVAHVQADQPDALVGYATVAVALAEEQLRGRLDIAPRRVALASEVLSDDGYERIRAAWGIEAREAYPTTEVGMIASGVPEDRSLTIWEDLVVVEVVDEAGRPVPDGTPGHRVLVTNLVSRLQPLIRYELADVVTTGPPAGDLPWRRITKIVGRTSEILDLPAIGGGTVRIHPHRLRRAFVGLRDVSVYQLRVAPRRLTARVVPAEGAGAGLADAVARALGEQLREAGAELPVAVEVIDALARDAAKAAKLQTVVIETG